jgi:antirestriction protein ArdC
MAAKKNIYDMVTERIEELLNQGIIPWEKPWKPGAGEFRNLISKKPYRGVNVFLLSAMGYDSPFWLTFNQARQLGGKVKNGEKGTPVIFWKWLLKDQEEENGSTGKVKIPLLRYYTVFNVEQCEDIPAGKIPAIDEIEEDEMTPIEAAAELIKLMPQRPIIEHCGNRASYSPSLDRVRMPDFEQFESAEFYYNVMFHELGHSTGHPSRLDRKEIVTVIPFGSEDYSKEELVAEMTAAFLCGVTGIEQTTINNSAAYIQSWLKKLKNDRKLVVLAAAAAQKAADFIRGIEQTMSQDEQQKTAA